jgi:CheY-like chemotaxis protein
MFSGIAEERNISFDLDLTPMMVQVDREKLEGCLLNIISNAFKFTPEAGRISLKSCVLDGSTVQIDVGDSGPGVPIKLRQSIFQRFNRADDHPSTSRVYGGIGLGLAIASENILALGGAITVLDSEDGGALFRVIFPMLAPNIEKIFKQSDVEMPNNNTKNIQQYTSDTEKQTIFDLKAHLSSAHYNSQLFEQKKDQLTVLVIEDNSSMNQFICSILQDYYLTLSASDGEDGMKKLATTIPDCIICDVMMPNMSGSQFVANLRSNKKYNMIPVIMLTAKVDSDVMIQLLNSGAQDCITKPFKSQDLLARINNLITTGMAWNALQTAYDQQSYNINQLTEDIDILLAENNIVTNNPSVVYEENIN